MKIWFNIIDIAKICVNSFQITKKGSISAIMDWVHIMWSCLRREKPHSTCLHNFFRYIMMTNDPEVTGYTYLTICV